MSDLRTAAKQALEALEWHENQPNCGAFAGRADALRAALEQDAVERGKRYVDGQSDWDAAIDAALEKDNSVTAPPIWETLAEIGESAPAGTWDALPAQSTDKETRELWVLLQLRVALGDPTGELMQDELVERARDAWADAQLYRMLRAAEKKE